MIEILYPPVIRELPEDLPVIFINGPVQGAPDWQAEAIELISLAAGQDDLAIASPRNDYDMEVFIYEDQVDWETHYRARSAKLGGHLFWLAGQTEPTPGRSYAQTSRFELGESKMLHQRDSMPLVVGIDEGFGNARYIRRRLGLECPAVPIVETLAETCQVAIELMIRR